jgi:hypothetical protein
VAPSKPAKLVPFHAGANSPGEELQILSFLKVVCRNKQPPKNLRLNHHVALAVLLSVPTSLQVFKAGRDQFNFTRFAVKQHTVTLSASTVGALTSI